MEEISPTRIILNQIKYKIKIFNIIERFKVSVKGAVAISLRRRLYETSKSEYNDLRRELRTYAYHDHNKLNINLNDLIFCLRKLESNKDCWAIDMFHDYIISSIPNYDLNKFDKVSEIIKNLTLMINNDKYNNLEEINDLFVGYFTTQKKIIEESKHPKTKELLDWIENFVIVLDDHKDYDEFDIIR